MGQYPEQKTLSVHRVPVAAMGSLLPTCQPVLKSLCPGRAGHPCNKAVTLSSRTTQLALTPACVLHRNNRPLFLGNSRGLINRVERGDLVTGVKRPLLEETGLLLMRRP